MMSEENNPELMEVEIGGVKLSLPKEDALKVIQDRDTKTKAYNELRAQAEAREAAEKSAVERAKQEEERRIALEAAQKGQTEQLENHYKSQLVTSANETKLVSIKAELASNESIVKSALPDAVAMLSSDPAIVREGGKLMHKRADGTLEPFSAFVADWLKERPYLQSSKLPPKSGGDADPIIPAGVEVITRAEYDKNPREYAAQIAARKLIVKG